METIRELLPPGLVVEFDTLHQMAPFENALSLQIEPEQDEYSLAAWQTRTNIIEALRPPKKGRSPAFNGTMMNMAWTVMEEPYERLLDSRQRRWQLQSQGNRIGRLSEHNKSQIGRYIGFEITADARSSGRGIIGQVCAEAWYYPVPEALVGSADAEGGERYVKATASYGGRLVNRMLTIAKLDLGPVPEPDPQAPRIAAAVLLDALQQ